MPHTLCVLSYKSSRLVVSETILTILVNQKICSWWSCFLPWAILVGVKQQSFTHSFFHCRCHCKHLPFDLLWSHWVYCNQTLHEWCLLQPLQKLLMAKNKTTMSKSSDLLKLLKSSLKLQVQMICNLVHIMSIGRKSLKIPQEWSGEIQM
jgi:hypothetical protein